MNKNIVIGLLLIIILLLGYMALKPKTAVINQNSTVTTTQPTSAAQPQPVAVAGMQKYTDTNFGFSFWYPDTWTATTPVNPPFGAQLKSVTVVKSLGLQPAGQDYPSIIIQEAHSTTRTITDTGGAGPIGPVTFYFDPTTHLWMTIPPEGDGSTKPADISLNTMGGLHMFAGTSRFNTRIVPLSADNFVVVGNGGAADSDLLVKTIVATDPSVAIPVSTADQNKALEAEKAGILPQ